ncbi:cyanoexosortase A system-associated protein, partial [Trichormus azollae HNT15244]
TACINPPGGSSVTSSQFMKKQYKYDLSSNYLLPAIAGQNLITDDRCIWTQLSIPLDRYVATEIYTVLESIWNDNYATSQSLFLTKY